MPELPEVEVARIKLSREVIGQTIIDVICHEPKMLNLSNAKFASTIRGSQINGVERRAKLLILRLNNGLFLVFHLKMTGQLVWLDKKRLVMVGHPMEKVLLLPNKFTRAIFICKTGRKLYFNDSRKFGYIKLVNKEQLEAIKSEFGPEALGKEFSLAYLSGVIARHPGRPIKTLLMDQHIIAGIGNIYADEVLYAAKVAPWRRAGSLKPSEIKAIHINIGKILAKSVKLGSTSYNNYLGETSQNAPFMEMLAVYGRQGQKCHRWDDGVIAGQKIGGRTAHFCTKCQK